MTQYVRILASLLDDCWEPASAADALRGQASPDDQHAGEAHRYCLVVPDGDQVRARIASEGETFDDSKPPDRTRYLWVLAADVPSRDELLRLYSEHLDPAEGQTPCRVIRDEFVGLLQFLGSSESQREYQRKVEWVHTPTEMINMFADVYLPHWPHWVGCFTSGELEELSSLNAVVEAAAEVVSHDLELEDLLGAAPWQRMMREARRVGELLAAGA